MVTEERYDTIDYEDNWQSVPVVRAKSFEPYEEFDSEEEYAENDDTEPVVKKQLPDIPQPVIKLQFIFSMIVLVVAFLLKNFGGDFYQTVKSFYFDNLNQSVVITFPVQDFVPEPLSGALPPVGDVVPEPLSGALPLNPTSL